MKLQISKKAMIAKRCVLGFVFIGFLLFVGEPDLLDTLIDILRTKYLGE